MHNSISNKRQRKWFAWAGRRNLFLKYIKVPYPFNVSFSFSLLLIHLGLAPLTHHSWWHSLTLTPEPGSLRLQLLWPGSPLTRRPAARWTGLGPHCHPQRSANINTSWWGGGAQYVTDLVWHPDGGPRVSLGPVWAWAEGGEAGDLAQGVGLLARGGLVAPLPPSRPRPGIIRVKCEYFESELCNMNLEQ